MKSQPHQSNLFRRKRLLLSSVAPILFLIYAARTQYTYSSSARTRLAVVNFVDESDEYLWGVYSTHTRLRETGMTAVGIQHVAMVSQDIHPNSKALLEEWLGRDQVIEFDRNIVLNQLVNEGLRSRNGVFLKLQAFNLTQYDKIIVLDSDILVRTNIAHWFDDYPAPAATGAKGRIEWNSGAMVIEPSTELYQKLLQYLPRVQKWDEEKDTGEDVWDSSAGHQGYLSAFFLSNVTSHSMFTMPLGSSILSSSLEEHAENQYLFRYRPEVFETVHFTKHKPFAQHNAHKIKSSNHVVCSMLREWKQSVAGAPLILLPKLPDFLRDCPEVNPENDGAIE